MHHFAGILTEDKVRHTHRGRATTYSTLRMTESCVATLTENRAPLDTHTSINDHSHIEQI